ncbi:hypothetical protein LIER_42232 [Lithospermum erythrorhizon]|uniref:DUF4283 domain-containing protein n=1 Tax=Lithospermum erythrorhizon TaxID=34254 RepID=A0AAV3RQ83_LITER
MGVTCISSTKIRFSLHAMEEETVPVQLEETDFSDGIIGCELSFYVKVHSERDGFVSTQGFTFAMARAWNCKDIRVSRIQGSILQVFFATERDKERVMKQGPWCFHNKLVVVEN